MGKKNRSRYSEKAFRKNFRNEFAIQMEAQIKKKNGLSSSLQDERRVDSRGEAKTGVKLRIFRAIDWMVKWARGFLGGMKKWERIGFLIILFFGVVMRLSLVVRTSIDSNSYQHDVDGRYGHMHYIVTIYETGRLPQTNLRQYYHPPLHHLIAAGFLKIESIFMDDLTEMTKGLKILAVVYAVGLIVIIWKITGELGFSIRMKRMILLVYLVHPMLMLMTISVNNDPLSILLIHWSLLWLIRWWKKPSIKGAGILGLFTGLAVMTKTSGLVLYLVELIVFIVKMMKTRKGFLKMAAVFMIISLPIGLWYPVRNYIRFGQELTYVLDPADFPVMVSRPPVDFATKKANKEWQEWWEKYNDAIYVGDEDIFRFPRREDLVNGIIGSGPVIGKTPILVAGSNFYMMEIRSAMLEEYIPIGRGEWGAMITVMSMNFILVGMFVIMMGWGIWQMWRRRDFSVEWIWWVIIISLSVILMFGCIKTMIQLPYKSTANFRYITPMILAMATMLGMIAREGGKWRAISEVGFCLVLASCMISDIMILI